MEQLGADGVERTLIHLVLPGTENRVACMPRANLPPPPDRKFVHMKTGDVRAVTCPACLRVSGGAGR